MDFTITSTKRRCRGMTLVETLIATGIGTVILTAVMAVSLFSARSFAALGNYVDLDIKSRQALDLMSQDTYTLSYTYDPTVQTTNNPTGQTLTRTKTKAGVTASKVLLTGCTYLKFDMFQRSPQTSTYDLYTASSPATCKLIQLTWVCSRDVLRGRFSNTESVQSAKVVIRKQ
ncbi:MAG: hypothetical protein DME22_11130 [Verrucomicrobia bacterium]|nr:MAG: hypothetical protein DME22_11130 [Verrucomicrobiota bacterium]